MPYRARHAGLCAQERRDEGQALGSNCGHDWSCRKHAAWSQYAGTLLPELWPPHSLFVSHLWQLTFVDVCVPHNPPLCNTSILTEQLVEETLRRVHSRFPERLCVSW